MELDEKMNGVFFAKVRGEIMKRDCIPPCHYAVRPLWLSALYSIWARAAAEMPANLSIRALKWRASGMQIPQGWSQPLSDRMTPLIPPWVRTPKILYLKHFFVCGVVKYIPYPCLAPTSIISGPQNMHMTLEPWALTNLALKRGEIW